MRRLMGLMISLMMLWACSSDDEMAEAPVAEREMPIELSASAVRYQEVEEPAANRRSWTPPSGYFLYSSLYEYNGSHYVNFANVNLANKSINAFFTRATDDEPNAEDPTYAFYPYHGRLRYISTPPSKWRLSINKVDPTNIKSGNYYVYGFIPSDAADDATIALLPEKTSYTAGAKLTIKGLRTAGYDACVIIGAREGFDIDHDGGYTDTNGNSTYDEGTDSRTNRLVAGDFKINLKTGKSATNYLYLLFDHLCSALSIGIKVDGDYNTLRTIKLKQLTLQTATESGLMAEKADVVVDLVANTMGINPISGLSYGATDKGASVYLSDEGLTLTTSYQSFLSHFLPITGVTKVVITCVYDVYDKDTSINPAGNLVRKDCKVSNTIRLSDIISYFPGVQRGWKYGINMTVKPTYLYVLSDPDLDNPTVSVE